MVWAGMGMATKRPRMGVGWSWAWWGWRGGERRLRHWKTSREDDRPRNLVLRSRVFSGVCVSLARARLVGVHPGFARIRRKRAAKRPANKIVPSITQFPSPYSACFLSHAWRLLFTAELCRFRRGGSTIAR